MLEDTFSKIKKIKNCTKNEVNFIIYSDRKRHIEVFSTFLIVTMKMLSP